LLERATAQQDLRLRLPKVPDFTAQTHSLIEALLAHQLVCEEGRESDGRMIYRVTDEGHATGMKSLVPRMNRAAAEALLEEVLARIASINSDGGESSAPISPKARISATSPRHQAGALAD